MNQATIEANRFKMDVALNKRYEMGAELEKKIKISFIDARDFIILTSNAEMCRFKWLLHKGAVEKGILSSDFVREYDLWWNIKEIAKESKTAEELFTGCFLVMRNQKMYDALAGWSVPSSFDRFAYKVLGDKADEISKQIFGD